MYVIVKNDHLYFNHVNDNINIVIFTADLSLAHTFCTAKDAYDFVNEHASAFIENLGIAEGHNNKLTINEIQYDPLRVVEEGTLIHFPNKDDFATCMNPPQESVDDVVNHPSHYETGKFECIEVMQEALGYDAVRDFCVCNAFKYLYRHKRKNGYEDIKKAQWYLNKYVEITEDAKKNGLEGM